jgi:hypothetical protein
MNITRNLKNSICRLCLQFLVLESLQASPGEGRAGEAGYNFEILINGAEKSK